MRSCGDFCRRLVIRFVADRDSSGQQQKVLVSSVVRATIGLMSAAAALLSAQAVAQAPAPEASAASKPQAEAPQGVDEVVVRGRRMSDVRDELHEYVQQFIRQVAKRPAGRGYARWQRHVCIGVHNLQSDAAQYIVDHISGVAGEIGLEPGEPGCRPDVIIIFTADGKSTASYIVENQPTVFRPVGGVGGVQLGLEALDDFAKSDKPVRWWHLAVPVDARFGQHAVRLPQDDSAPVVIVEGPSRIHSGIRDDLMYVLIIVDGKKLTGTTWQQLGDYLAVVSLAQIDPSANPTGFDSILNLFSNPQAYSGLTDWDRSYLRALYSFDQERMPRVQVNELVGRMTRQQLETGE
jgi:hypothetical protein